MYQPTFEIRVWTNNGWVPVTSNWKPLHYTDRAVAYDVRDQLLVKFPDLTMVVRRVA